MCKLDSENEEGTRDQIAKICCIIVKAWEFQKYIYTFASLATLKPLIVWTTTNCRKFLEMELPDHLTCFPRNLYTGQIATVKMTWNNGLPQNLERSTARLYTITLLIQLICRVHHAKCWLDESQAGIKVAKRNTNNLIYADHTIIMA